MIYFCINTEFDSVEEIAGKYFDKIGENRWQTRQRMGKVHRGFFLSQDTFMKIPQYESGAVIRMYANDVMFMLAGEGLDTHVNEMSENNPRFPITLEVREGIAVVRTQIPETMRSSLKGYDSSRWPCSKTAFGKMMAELWDPRSEEVSWEAHDITFDIERQKNVITAKKGIEYMILGKDLAPDPGKDAIAMMEVVFNPFPSRGGSGVPEYTYGPNGEYYAKGCEPVGKSVAEANGVDLTRFEPSPYDP